MRAALTAALVAMLASPCAARAQEAPPGSPTETRSPTVVAPRAEARGTPAGLDAAPTEAELRQRLDSLRPLLDRAQRDVEAFRRRQREALRRTAPVATDTVQVGPLRIVAAEGRAAEAREVVEPVWTARYAGFVERSPALERATFTFGLSNDQALSSVGVANVHRLDPYADARGPDLSREVRQAIGGVLWEDVPEGSALARWAGAEAFQEDEPQATYRRVATTPSRAVRSCLAGGLPACRAALGLERGSAAFRTPAGTAVGAASQSMLDTWYTSEERRALVLRTRVGRESDPRRRLCVAEQRTSACDALLREGSGDLAPLPAAVRSTLVRYALERGGRGAWSRLVERGGALEALAHASGLAPEELLAGWRSSLLEGRPEVYAGLAGRSVLALLWILFFATLATRSTRWRSR